MIIKSNIRGGYRSAAEYLKEQGQNEKTRLVEISDPSAKNLDDAFHNMWVVACNTRCTKPLHHISINPMKDERLTDEQVMAVVERCEEKYGYKMFHHQRVIVEHIRDGRQHFHVIWNRVSLYTGRPVWPGEHWNKSKQVCREMERELGLKRPTSKRMRSPRYVSKNGRPRAHKKGSRVKKAKTNHHIGFNKSRSKLNVRGYKKPSLRTGAGIRHSKLRTAPARIRNSGRTQNTAGRYESLRSIKLPSIKPAYSKPLKQILMAEPTPHQPVKSKTGGWPEAAILDWKTWGYLDPRRFFARWPELAM